MPGIDRMDVKIKSLAKVRLLVLFAMIAGFISSACAPMETQKVPVAIPATQVIPAHMPGFGILGDSTSDEYRADDARGGKYGETTLNWMEQLVRTRGLNFGAWGTWGEPRRTGYEYNWARTGATIESMIASGQHTGLAQQVAAGRVSFVLIWIGNNDFHLKNGPYEKIYDGTLRDADLQKKIDRMATDLATAMDTILQAGDVTVAIVTIADQGIAPQARILFPDSEKRQRVTKAVNDLNGLISELAEARGVLVLDSNAVGAELFGRVNLLGEITIGDQKITVLTKGDEPHHLQLADNIGHAGTVLSGIIANRLFLQTYNNAQEPDIQLLSDQEILTNAGMK